jgi:hypothetical protein
VTDYSDFVDKRPKKRQIVIKKLFVDFRELVPYYVNDKKFPIGRMCR